MLNYKFFEASAFGVLRNSRPAVRCIFCKQKDAAPIGAIN